MKIINKKRLAVLLASALLLVVTVGGTIAFLVASTDPLVNTFTPTSVDVTVTDKVENGVKKEVVITNNSSTSAYIRARIVGGWVSNEDNTTVVQKWNPASDGTFEDTLPGPDWHLQGSYYYYTKPVAPYTAIPDPLFTSYKVTNTVDGAHLVLDILVQAIQAEGITSDGKRVVEAAWGVDPSKLN